MSARERLLAAARDLFQRQGFHGVGVADILARADAPKGSLYHHFPGGKDELAAVAVAGIAADVSGYIRDRVDKGRGGIEIASGIADMCARRMAQERFDWSPLMSALGAQTDRDFPRLAGALAGGYGSWREPLSRAFAQDGLGEGDCVRAAHLAILVLEGAITLTRATRDTAPLALIGPLLRAFVSSLVSGERSGPD